MSATKYKSNSKFKNSLWVIGSTILVVLILLWLQGFLNPDIPKGKIVYFRNTINNDLSELIATNGDGSSFSVARWCGKETNKGCSVNTVLIAGDLFTADYQNGISQGLGRAGAKYKRPASFTLDEKIQFTFGHELSHILADANPELIASYIITTGNIEENMANELSLHATSHGVFTTTFSEFASDYGVWDIP